MLKFKVLLHNISGGTITIDYVLYIFSNFNLVLYPLKSPILGLDIWLIKIGRESNSMHSPPSTSNPNNVWRDWRRFSFSDIYRAIVTPPRMEGTIILQLFYSLLYPLMTLNYIYLHPSGYWSWPSKLCYYFSLRLFTGREAFMNITPLCLCWYESSNLSRYYSTV